MAEAKICGLTEPVGLAAALAGRARFIGLMLFDKGRGASPSIRAPSSPRWLADAPTSSP